MKKVRNELKNKNLKDLVTEEQKLREEIAKMKLETKVNPVKDSNLLMKKRKRLAVILTMITEKDQAVEAAKVK